MSKDQKKLDGAEFAAFQNDAASVEEIQSVIDSELDAIFDRRVDRFNAIAELRSACAVAIDAGDQVALDEAMLKIADARKEIVETRKTALRMVKRIESALDQMDKLRARGRIWTQRATSRFDESREFVGMVLAMTRQFSSTGARLTFLKGKIAKMVDPAAKESAGPVRCPRCNGDRVIFLRADLSAKHFKCEGIGCPDFQIALKIPEEVVGV